MQLIVSMTVIHEAILTDCEYEHSIFIVQQFNDVRCVQKAFISLQEFELDPLVLQINMAYWADIFVRNPDEDTTALRHAAYRQFVLWRHGRLGTNVRRACPPALC